MRDPNLLAWQWSLYPRGHRSRTNLLLHILTVPLFVLGVSAIMLAPFTSGWLAAVGAVGMILALVSQGRGHKTEQEPPVPFDGPGDFVRRFFAEQFVNFPRYVLTGGFTAAWRQSGEEAGR